MARETRVEKGGIIFLPVNIAYPKWKITIDDEDVTPYTYFSEVVRVATEALSYATINLDNYKGRFNDLWTPESKRHIVKIYFDYADSSNFTTHTPTNQIYQGLLDYAKPGLSSDGWIMQLKSRDRPELYDMTTTIEFNSQNITDAIKAVIDDLNTKAGYTVISYESDSIESTTTLTSINYRDERYINILTDLSTRAGFDFRIECDGEFVAFTSGSQVCLMESIVSGQNMYSCPNVGKDGTNIKNYIKVYGPELEDCLIMATKKSITFTPWRKDEIVNDTAIQNVDQAEDRADKEYNNLYDSEIVASPICVGLPYLLVGESLRTYIAYCGMDEYYVVSRMSHVFSMAGVETRVTLGELEKDGLRLIKNNERDIREKQTFNNPNGMEFSYHFTFDDESQVYSHNNTKLSNGKLSLAGSADAGTMISESKELDYDVSYAEVRFKGNDDCDACTFEVSLDDGQNYEEIEAGINGNYGPIKSITNTGNKIKIKINLNSNSNNLNPEIESLVILTR